MFLATDALLSSFKVFSSPLAKELLAVMQLCQLGSRHFKTSTFRIAFEGSECCLRSRLYFLALFSGDSIQNQMYSPGCVLISKSTVLNHTLKSCGFRNADVPRAYQTELALGQRVNKTLVRGDI